MSFAAIKAPLLACLILTAVLSPAGAEAVDVRTVAIKVEIGKNGSASVVEDWELATEKDGGSEFSILRPGLATDDIARLEVEEIAGNKAAPAKTRLPWKVKESEEGAMISWWLPERSSNHFRVSYKVASLVKSFLGGDALSMTFLEGVAGGVGSFNIFIHTDAFDMAYPETQIWFSGFHAYSLYDSGGVEIRSDGPFIEGDRALVLLKFDTGLFSPTDRRTQPIEDFIKEQIPNPVMAVPNGRNTWLTLIVAVVLGAAAAFFFIAKHKRYKAGHLTKMRGRVSSGDLEQQIRKGARVEPCSDLPFCGELSAAYYRLCDIGEVDEGRAFGCLLLEWIRTGHVAFASELSGYLSRQQSLLILNPQPRISCPVGLKLYRLLLEAADEEAVLRWKPLADWVAAHKDTVREWLTDYQSSGFKSLLRQHAYSSDEYGKVLLTPHGRELTNQAFGFKRFLEGMESENLHDSASSLWDRRLVFAHLLGVSKPVSEQLDRIAPSSSASVAVSLSFTASMRAGCRNNSSTSHE